MHGASAGTGCGQEWCVQEGVGLSEKVWMCLQGCECVWDDVDLFGSVSVWECMDVPKELFMLKRVL